jgi:hypothetical protein
MKLVANGPGSVKGDLNAKARDFLRQYLHHAFDGELRRLVDSPREGHQTANARNGKNPLRRNKITNPSLSSGRLRYIRLDRGTSQSASSFQRMPGRNAATPVSIAIAPHASIRPLSPLVSRTASATYVRFPCSADRLAWVHKPGTQRET